MRNLFLLAAVICFGMAIIKFFAARTPANAPASRRASRKYLTLTAEEAKARLDEAEDVILLDVRTQEEYDGGHIPGAVCLPSEDITADLPLPFGRDAEILVYCRSGRRSAEAAEKLADMGYENVADFGGILDWPYETTTD
nr:rhodanese-like domain-containing protein [uncultured Oscillibacter sp.]